MRAFQTNGNKDHTGNDKCHQGHTRYGVTTHDSDSVSGYGSKQEGDNQHDEEGDNRLHQVVDNADVEEHEGDQQGCQQGKHEHLHRDVTLVTLHLLTLALLLALEGLSSQSSGTLDNAPRLDDADDTAHGDTANTDKLSATSENVFGRCRSQFRIHRAHERHNHPPNESTTCKDDKGIRKTDDVAHTQGCGTGIHLEDHLHILGKAVQRRNSSGGKHFFPPVEGREHEVIGTAHDTGNEQMTHLAATLLTAHEHLGGRGSFGERELAMLVANEVLAEGDKEQDAQATAQQRTQENLQEVHRDVGILGLQDVKSRQGEDGTGNDDARRGTNRLDDDILAQRVLALGRSANASGNDGNGDSGLKHLTQFQAQVGGSGTEDDRHNQTQRDRVGRNLGIRLVGLQDGDILLPRLELARSVLGQRHLVLLLNNDFFVFHKK